MVNVQVYGTKVICASCVGMPSSTETFEWLQAAIGRKYEGQENKFNFEYIDFQEEQEDEEKSIRRARSGGRFILSGRSCKWRNCWRRKSSFEGCLRRNREIFIKQEVFANLQRLFYWRDSCEKWSEACVTNRSTTVNGTIHSRIKRNFLDEKIVGVYIYGSIALGAFHIETSDVDFVTVISDSVNKAEKQQLVELHKKLSGSTLGKRMDGMYIPLADLGKYNDEMNEYVYCADGKANIGHWDINAVTWWTLKNQGITVTGKEAEDLSFQIRWDDVVNTMKYNVERYWSEKAKQPYLFL